jgi:hypothetical protein
MKRNAIQIFALIGAISAGGVAHADSGYNTGHHELIAKSAGTNNGVQTKSSVTHNGAFSDEKVTPENADSHPRNAQSRDVMMSSSMDSGNQLLPGTGNNR